ncbi:MAG TPA: hypothetical protein VND91_08585 [Candidatus Saccharimonadia bacterium]|nr:hypothetical protein [Candidatus Saccharimonadia bacterium]
MADPARATYPIDGEIGRRRASARRTALAIGLVAVAIYAAFLLSGVFGAL